MLAIQAAALGNVYPPGRPVLQEIFGMETTVAEVGDPTLGRDRCDPRRRSAS